MPEEKKDVIEVLMPKMGESIMEGTILRWMKKPGDLIKKDEIIFEISTDKVDTEVPSPAEGVMLAILVNEQETVPVGTVVARISGQDEQVHIIITREQVTPDSALMHEVIGANATRMQNSQNQVEHTTAAPPIVNEKKQSRFYSPLVLNISTKEHISHEELAGIQGTGISGRITKNDMLRYLELRKNPPQQIDSAETESHHSDLAGRQGGNAINIPGQVEYIPMDNIRQKIMRNMVLSRDAAVHVTGMIEVDMSGIANYIKQKKDILIKQEGVKLTFLPFIAAAAVRALKEFPLVNSTIDGNTIVQKRFVNMGIAVAMEPNGLIVPNVKNAHEKNIFGLARAIHDLAEKARSKKLSPDDVSGGTFSITNYGVFGTLFGTPIINPPEVAILGVGTVLKRPVVIELNSGDSIAIKPMMFLTLSHDHRLVDGMLGGRFLQFVKEQLEHFTEEL